MRWSSIIYAPLQISAARTCFDARLVQDYVGELISIPREIEFMSNDGQNTVKGLTSRINRYHTPASAQILLSSLQRLLPASRRHQTACCYQNARRSNRRLLCRVRLGETDLDVEGLCDFRRELSWLHWARSALSRLAHRSMRSDGHR